MPRQELARRKVYVLSAAGGVAGSLLLLAMPSLMSRLRVSKNLARAVNFVATLG